jgi:hypothetical protein
MKTMRFTALNLAVVLALLASSRAEAQATPARNPAPVQANSAQVSPQATAAMPTNAPQQPANAQAQPLGPAPAMAPPAAAPPPQAMTPMPGQSYLVLDPATGQAMPMITYGPMFRPRPAELPYTTGAPIPRGYVLQEYHPRGLIIGGAVTLGVLYMISFSVAASNDFNSANGWLAVPIIGPFGWLATRKAPVCGVGSYTYACGDESSNRTMVALDGMGQAAGAAMLIAGLAITRRHLVLIDQSEIMVAPYASSTDSGLRIFGQF